MSGTTLRLPKLYPILDVQALAARGMRSTGEVVGFAQSLFNGGATFLQYRNKAAPATGALSQAREIRRIAGRNVQLVMNDRTDLMLAAGFDGVHLGQDDLSAQGARTIVGDEMLIGLSTHNATQVREAETLAVDYIAVGPIFATASKLNPEPVAGLELIRVARAITRKPLVAIGGINRHNCRSAIDAGADSVAVISDLLDSPQKRVEEFFRLLG